MKYLMFVLSLGPGETYFPVGHGVFGSKAECEQAGIRTVVAIPEYPPGLPTQFVCVAIEPPRADAGPPGKLQHVPG